MKNPKQHMDTMNRIHILMDTFCNRPHELPGIIAKLTGTRAEQIETGKDTV